MSAKALSAWNRMPGCALEPAEGVPVTPVWNASACVCVCARMRGEGGKGEETAHPLNCLHGGLGARCGLVHACAVPFSYSYCICIPCTHECLPFSLHAHAHAHTLF